MESELLDTLKIDSCIPEMIRNERWGELEIQYSSQANTILSELLTSNYDLQKITYEILGLIFNCRFCANLAKKKDPFFEIIKNLFLSGLQQAELLIKSNTRDSNDIILFLEALHFLKPEGGKINSMLAEIYRITKNYRKAKLHAKKGVCFGYRSTESLNHIIRILSEGGDLNEELHYKSLVPIERKIWNFQSSTLAPTVKYFSEDLNSSSTYWFFGDSYLDPFLYIATNKYNLNKNISTAIIPGAAISKISCSSFTPPPLAVANQISHFIKPQDKIFIGFGTLDAHYTGDQDIDLKESKKYIDMMLDTLLNFVRSIQNTWQSSIAFIGAHPPVVKNDLINVWGRGPFIKNNTERFMLVEYFNRHLEALAQGLESEYVDINDIILENGTVKNQFRIHDQEDHLSNEQVSKLWVKKLNL